MSSFQWPNSGGVTDVNGLSGSITLAAGSNITLTPVGNTITIDAAGGGGGGITTVGTIDSQTAATNGLVISGTSIYAQSASLTKPGLVNNSAQTFSGIKTFNDSISASNLSGTNTGDQTTITGNAGTATVLATARAINGVNFDGSAAITVTAAAGTLTGATLKSTVTASSLTSVGTLATLTVTATITGNISGSSGSTTGNAATVTTNANLTGPITSVGNATSIASQTGTGTKFVMDTSPTLVTPNLGTPSTLVGTNITGTAAGLSIGGNAANVSGTVVVSNGGTGLATLTANSLIVGNGTSNPSFIAPSSSGNILVSNGSTWLSTAPTFGTSNANASFVLSDATVPYVNIGGTHYQVGTQSLTQVRLSMLNSGTSGTTVIQVNQYRSGSLFNSATASISASSGNPAGSNASLSGTLSLLAGDIITVDVNSVAGGLPESITVEY